MCWHSEINLENLFWRVSLDLNNLKLSIILGLIEEKLSGVLTMFFSHVEGDYCLHSWTLMVLCTLCIMNA